MPAVLKPKKLQPGDTIGIIAPSEPILDKRELDQAKLCLSQLGYNVKTGAHVLEAVGDYVAGSPGKRAKDFNWAFSDPEVDAVFVALGGMGASQILELINFENAASHPKIFAGYSDTTTLQIALLAKTGLVTFHGPHAMSLPEFKRSGYTLTNFWKALTADKEGMVIKPQSEEWHGLIEGEGKGVLVGGNISCFCNLLGTPWDPVVALSKIFGKTQKYLFFWEEADEQFSEVMRNLWQLRNTGFFQTISGMIVGKLTDVAEKDYQNFPHKKDLIREICQPFKFPILYGVDFGHDVPRATIPIGVEAFMDTKAKRLEILEPTVI